jgi:putative ABC transport system permease protein
MITLLLKSNLRLITRNKELSIVKITGLMIGSAIFLMTALFCWHEFQYDRQHPEYDRIHRYVHRVNTPEGLQSFAFTSAMTGLALKERFTEVEDFCRIFVTYAGIRNAGADISFNERRFAFADQNFLTFYHFPLRGNVNPKTILTEPFSLILTPEMAKKYFAHQDPVGKTILFNNEISFIVKGVFQENFNTTHFDLDFVASFATLDAIKNHPIVSRQIPATLNLEAKGFNAFYTYLKLSPDSSPAALEAKFPAYIEAFRGPGRSERLKPSLQSLSSIHLYSNLLYEIGNNGSARIVYVYFFIGSLILLIACINYINTSTAEFLKRARGIGLKKILGIERSALMLSHLIETVLLTSISLVMGSIAAYLLMPAFNMMVDRKIDFVIPQTLIIIAAIFVAVTFVSGLYPAIMITRAHALESFKGELKGNPSAFNARHALVFVQLLISFCLVTVSLLIYRQLDYLLKKDPGFDSSQIITLNASSATKQQRAILKERLVSDKNVLSAAMCSVPPGGSLFSYGITLPENDGDAERRVAVYQAFVDNDFITTMGINLSEGRFFDPLSAADSGQYMVFNQAAAKAVGGSVLNRELKLPDLFATQQVTKSVVGIIEDFNFASFHQEIQPLILEYNPGRCQYLLVRFRGTDAAQTVRSIEGAWKEIIPQLPFDYYFMDEGFARFYDQEQRQKNMIACIAFLAISLAALGIYGTTLFLVQQRTKEVGIRKILGSRRIDILWLLMRPTLNMVIVSSVAGIPLAWATGNAWLEQYPYRIGFPPSLFAIAFCILVAVITMTILHRFLKVTRVNPTEVLRHY